MEMAYTLQVVFALQNNIAFECVQYSAVHNNILLFIFSQPHQQLFRIGNAKCIAHATATTATEKIQI